MLVNQLEAVDSTAVSSSKKSNGTCDCNGNGKCVDKKCVCDPGFKLDDCSMSED